MMTIYLVFFFFSSRRRHTRWTGDWSSDVCSSDLGAASCPDVAEHRRIQPCPFELFPLLNGTIRRDTREYPSISTIRRSTPQARKRSGGRHKEGESSCTTILTPPPERLRACG